MKKLFTLTLALVASISFAFAQQYVSEGPVTILKTEVNGFTINIPKVDSKSATTAITEFLAEKGLVKPKSDDKFTSYKAQKFEVIGEGTYDIYFKAVQKGKKKDISSDIIFICSFGNLNTVSSSNHAIEASNIKAFMSKFPKVVEKYQLKKQIEANTKEKEKAEKELKKMQDKLSKATSKQNDLLKQLEEAKNKLKDFTID